MEQGGNMFTEEQKQEIKQLVDLQVAELLRTDATNHREFLHSTFKWITWAIGLLVATALGAGNPTRFPQVSGV